MRRIAFLILALSLLLCFTGCDSENPASEQEPSAVTSTPSPDETTVAPPSSEPPAVYGLPLAAVATALTEEDYFADDGTLLLRYTCQNLVLTLEDPQIADAITVDFLNLVDPAGQDINKILLDAKAAYEAGNTWSPYTFKRLYTPMRLDNTILSMYGTQVLSPGMDGTSTAGISITYDVVTGQRLSLNQILTDDFSADVLVQAIINSLSDIAAEGMLYSDYAYVITELFATNRPVESWFLSNKGLCFYFAPYEIAPYSAGTIVAEVPYDQLPGILKDSYFPEETVEFVGTLSAENFAAADTSDLTQFAELVLDQHGTEYLIRVCGAVGDFRLEIGTWQHDGVFIPEAALFAASTLCSSDALVIKVTDPMIPNIRVIYHSGGSRISIPLSDILKID